MYFCIFIVCVNTMTSMIKTDPFFDLIDFQVQRVFLHVGLDGNPRNVLCASAAALLARPGVYVQDYHAGVRLGAPGRGERRAESFYVAATAEGFIEQGVGRGRVQGRYESVRPDGPESGRGA